MSAVKITLQTRVSPWGQKIYRAIMLIHDQAVDGYGKTPDEAHEALKLKVSGMVLALKQQHDENNQPPK